MTYRELLSMLVDLKGLCARPLPGESGGCMSSFDRASAYDPETDTYACWDANDDGSGCIRRLGDGSIVAFECEGPGVIWRTWSALPRQGHIRVFFDGEAQPQIDTPFADWFEAQPGEIPPLNLSELSLRLSRGRNSFIPIPFQKSCRIELAEGWGAYYHFTYTRFPEGTALPAYGERFSRDGMIALAETDRLLYDRGEAFHPDMVIREAGIGPGESAALFEASGSGAIREMVFFPDHPLTNEASRSLILKVWWDGSERTAVEAPVGDFFGGPGYGHYRCLPMSMEWDRYTCRFYMPFERGCRVEVANLGATAAHVRMGFSVIHPPECVREPLRFHAKWHRGYDAGLERQRFMPGGDRWPDWPLLLIHGAAGRFAGVHMHIRNTWQMPVQPAESWWYGKWDRKNVDWWWGEGDEKFFVDGEKFPSTFGTGSEDYIGYAWAAEPPFARFDSPYAAMNIMPIDGNGDTCVSRFHIADNIPFQTSFEAFIEKYKDDRWGEGNQCLYAVTPYWYQSAGTDDPYPAITAEIL